jgi:hypothetical protein
MEDGGLAASVLLSGGICVVSINVGAALQIRVLQTTPSLAILPGISGYRGFSMADTAQKRAIRNYRTRLVKRGIARFEVLGLDADRDLIRSLAKRLAENDPDAVRIRAAVSQTIAGEPPGKGGILAALRRSPLVGADLNLARSRDTGRKVDL